MSEPDRPENLVQRPNGPLTRRALLGRGTAIGLGATTLPALLAACGSDDEDTSKAAGGAKKTYGGTGVADRAVGAARDLGAGTGLTLAFSSGNAGNFEPFYDEWKEQTGCSVKSHEIPVDQFVDKIFASATAKTSDWDLLAVQPRLFGDLIGAGALADISSYVDKYDPELDNEEHGFFQPQNRYATSYNGKVYGLDDDGDNFIYVFRRDLIEDPKEQQAFKSRFGYELAPATTWKQFRDIAEFFTREDDGLYGAAELVSTGWSFWFWQLRYASTAAPQAYYFDDDMQPLVNSPGGIAALQNLVDLKPFMPKDIPSWNYTQTYAEFAKGNIAQETAWSSLAKFSNSPETSKVSDKWGSARMPGTEVDGKLISRSIYGFGGSLMVWGHSKEAELAYLFGQWITSPELSGQMTAQPGFSDPFRINDSKNEQLAEIYSREVMEAYPQTAAESVPEIMLKGSNEYSNALDENITRAFAGQIDAEEAMSNVERDWNSITKRLGVESQKEAWQYLKDSYPQA